MPLTFSCPSLPQLAQEARNIYQEFLSSQALSPVNIDRQAWLGEEVLAEPRPDMFRAQQLQIFNLMKFDSYARFVKSPLYRECLLAEAEGRPLREPGSWRPGSPDATRKVRNAGLWGAVSRCRCAGVAHGRPAG